MLDGSALDGEWTRRLPKHDMTIVVMEGVLEYFSKDQVMSLVSETNYNEEMKKYSIRGKLFAIVGKNINNRLAVFKW